MQSRSTLRRIAFEHVVKVQNYALTDEYLSEVTFNRAAYQIQNVKCQNPYQMIENKARGQAKAHPLQNGFEAGATLADASL